MKDRLAAARERHAQRETRAAERRDEIELEALELCDRLEQETAGKLGVDFAVHATPFGVFAVKLVPAASAIYKRFVTKTETTPEDAEEFVRPCLAFPEEKKFLEVLVERPALAAELALKLVKLFGAQEEKTRGKF